MRGAARDRDWLATVETPIGVSYTDRMAMAPYAELGDDNALTLRGTGKKLSKLVVDAGLLNFDPAAVRAN